MAEPDLAPPPTLRAAVVKPKMTIYYALLIVAFVALLVACLFLYLEIRRFQREATGASLSGASHSLVAVAIRADGAATV
jgi:hypothetical protein